MLSRAEVRVRAEQALRVIVIVALAVMLWDSLHERSNARARTLTAHGIHPGALAEWSALAKAPASIHVQLDTTPSRIERAWLAALAGAGSSVTWSGDLAPVMIDAQPASSPTAATKVLVAAPRGASLVVSDEIGTIDTLRVQNNGAMLTLNAAPDRLTARVNGSVASAGAVDSVTLHKVLVIGNAGWESKFAIAALEEEGWKVDAIVRVAPGVDVAQGSPAAIDTSRYSAVVALDGASSPYAGRILAFAQTGGGVVLGPRAASLDAMASLRAGTVRDAPSGARPVQREKSIGIASLALTPITLLRTDAIPLEKRAGLIAIAARRVGAGRVIQVGYEDSWRWRMNGNEDAVRDHRLWWTGLVGTVAFARRVQRVSDAALTDEAPIAALVGAVGMNTPAAAFSSLAGNPGDWSVWLFLLLMFCLVAEIGSRRLRGAP